MKVTEVLAESMDIQSQIDQLASRNASLKQYLKYADGGAYQQDKAEITQNELAIGRLKAQMSDDSGETVSVSFNVPESVHKELHAELHKIWQGKGQIPWKMYQSKQQGMVAVRFDTVTPSESVGGGTVQDLIDRVQTQAA